MAHENVSQTCAIVNRTRLSMRRASGVTLGWSSSSSRLGLTLTKRMRRSRHLFTLRQGTLSTTFHSRGWLFILNMTGDEVKRTASLFLPKMLKTIHISSKSARVVTANCICFMQGRADYDMPSHPQRGQVLGQ